jgi:tRNA wybutosine-synthesizing protein 4
MNGLVSFSWFIIFKWILVEFLNFFAEVAMNCNEDSNVIETNTEAQKSKMSCVSAGYYEDKYIRFFCSSLVRRNPIINLGYAIRVAVFRNLVRSFVTAYPQSQIVSIGCGSDTLGFWVLENNEHVVMFEVDFPSVVGAKSRVIQKHQSVFNPVLRKSDNTEGTRLQFVGFDLRNDKNTLLHSLSESGYDFSKPSLFLAECALIYLDHDVNDRVTKMIAHSTENSGAPVFFASYDQVNPSDRFGQIMMTNLQARGCPLRSIEPDTHSQDSRLMSLGFSNSRVEYMSYFTNRCKTKRPEIIDEVEELNLLQDHYMFSFASSRTDKETFKFSSDLVFFEPS